MWQVHLAAQGASDRDREREVFPDVWEQQAWAPLRQQDPPSGLAKCPSLSGLRINGAIIDVSTSVFDSSVLTTTDRFSG